MARNKYPEQTIEKILNTASKLFIEKGYDKTTIQDILNELNMSKGAIYHHFKSKEEILTAVIEKTHQQETEIFQSELNKIDGKTAKEKLQSIIFLSMNTDNNINQTFGFNIKDPQFLIANLEKGVNIDAKLISLLLKEGNEDGSIYTKHPDEYAEIFLILTNFWLNPIIFKKDEQAMKQKVIALKDALDSIGINIINEDIINKILEKYQTLALL